MPAIGDLLAGRYRIDARLGAGGMATVWRARDLRLERDVAVKVLLPNLAGDPALAARFDREARALAAISDAHVVAIFDVVEGTQGSEPFLVMELCPDGSLGDRLADGASIAPEVALPVLADAAAGLAALHARGMVHRDVTPRNVLLVGGSAKLGDFGLARIEDSSTTPGVGLTATGAAVGTLGFLAPEILDGRTATPASDVYGLGAVAYRTLTGMLPRPAGSIAELVAARSRAVAPIGTLVPSLPAAAASAIDRALDADSARRPTAVDLARTFRPAASTPTDERTTLDAGRMAAIPAAPGWVRPPATPSPPPPAERASADVQPGASPPPSRPEPPAPSPPRRADAVPPSPFPGKRRRGRKPLPEAGPDYHGPGFWSGELIAIVVVVVVIIALVILFGGRPG
jgi:serine/threonine protein kinase